MFRSHFAKSEVNHVLNNHLDNVVGCVNIIDDLDDYAIDHGDPDLNMSWNRIDDLRSIADQFGGCSEQETKHIKSVCVGYVFDFMDYYDIDYHRLSYEASKTLAKITLGFKPMSPIKRRMAMDDLNFDDPDLRLLAKELDITMSRYKEV